MSLRKTLSHALAAGGLVLAPLSAALAQGVEEHPAPIATGPQVTTLSAELFANRPDDPTPFGVTLGGLMLVDAKANGGKLVAKGGATGVNTQFGGPTAQNAALQRRLARYIGQPLSFRLLSEIQAEITKFYRENGRSLVSVTVPQQEITGGVVQINITAFVLATTRIEGADPQSEGFLRRQVRLRPGQEVDTDTLLDDVNWLNQNPYRHVSVVFAPGQAQNSTNLTLRVRTGRPWSGYAGLSNAGTPDTGEYRVFAGANISALPWRDQQLSYQFTGSPESLGKFRLWDTGRDKGYLSHALTYFIPITTQNGFRTKLTFGASHISSYSVPGGVATTGTETVVLNGEAAIPLRKVSGRFQLVPELYAQVEYNDYDKTTFFGGFQTETDAELLHLAIGLRAGTNGSLFGRNSRGSIDVAYVIGRETTTAGETEFAFAKFNLKQEIFLENDHSLAFRLSGQRSQDVLHPLEQMALGGDGTVRGYGVNSVAGDSALAGSIEYRMSPWSFALGNDEGSFTPHIFADFGMTQNNGPGADETLSSIGFGGEIGLGKNIVGSLDIAQALEGAGPVSANSTSIAFQFTARF